MCPIAGEAPALADQPLARALLDDPAILDEQDIVILRCGGESRFSLPYQSRAVLNHRQKCIGEQPWIFDHHIMAGWDFFIDPAAFRPDPLH
jgi:hypothetical protein